MFEKNKSDRAAEKSAEAKSSESTSSSSKAVAAVEAPSTPQHDALRPADLGADVRQPIERNRENQGVQTRHDALLPGDVGRVPEAPLPDGATVQESQTPQDGKHLFVRTTRRESAFYRSGCAFDFNGRTLSPEDLEQLGPRAVQAILDEPMLFSKYTNGPEKPKGPSRDAK